MTNESSAAEASLSCSDVSAEDALEVQDSPTGKHSDSGSHHIRGKALVFLTATAWRWSYDRQAVCSFIGRYSAHLAVVALALLLGFVGRIAFSPDVAVVSAPPRSLPQQAAAEPVATPTSIITHSFGFRLAAPNAIVRFANPMTTIPERVRLNVITYTVQEGDTIFWIAERFKLSPYTIVWSNMETLQGSPWLISPGLTLSIPPIDGAYHVVMEDETVASIAEAYEVSSETLYNQWNDLTPGQALAEGSLLVIPGGAGDDFDWEPPPPEPSSPAVGIAAASWGYCGDTAVAGHGANGWFILPTGSYSVSGWIFADPRNPGHIGLDYRCRLGDPIVAADAGVVVWAGWNGGYGNLVRVRHGNGYETYYAHFSAYAVSCGDPVYQGQILGYCGSTGYSTGPHLHYEIRLNGVPQNPVLFEP